tara:strand:+ start:200 stop:511 length:312 start_codon:yes stop_codon:yes gene_type:complete
MKDKNDSQGEYVKPPSMLTMIRSFSKDLVTYVAQGAPNVSREDYVDRLDSCNNCEHLKKEHMRCGLCGCLLQHKARWKTTDCPDKPSRWKKQEYKEEDVNVKK